MAQVRGFDFAPSDLATVRPQLNPQTDPRRRKARKDFVQDRGVFYSDFQNFN
jgi:hypothetical protein